MDATPKADPRPKMYGPENVDRAVRALLPNVLDWLKANNSYLEEDENDVLEDLLSATSYRFNFDGFAIAYELQFAHSWECDSKLVDILGGLDSILYKLHKEDLKAWAKDKAPKYQVGQILCTKRAKKAPLEVYAVRADTLQYVVAAPGTDVKKERSLLANEEDLELFAEESAVEEVLDRR